MARNAHIVGKVNYRGGDGPAIEIRRGPVKVAMSDFDATLSWEDGEVHGSTAIPLEEFDRCVSEGKIRFDDEPAQRDT
ncbi:hypothetical protein LPB72_21155 [Hydrogenophaga crassostreae]|uniref:Uncharacterized protein n=1 Tax=Hydrogenophaga crassostreae TaxID=1763535 RepID=A0A167GIL7_9BURK|nr:hypothetical protein [Hydrogenophaga crassostreae]AOW15044.1 hypothetical protein LPB072_21770 [Hydrogenophaga crassostreae]OAD39496.1 hypothetical protein LPB72_21155 [Hydrogenophaga crassostreae]